MRWYITFGQIHVHNVNGMVFDKDCVGVINGETPEQCDQMAFDLFQGRFHKYAAEMPKMKYFPRGLIEVNPPKSNEATNMGVSLKQFIEELEALLADNDMSPQDKQQALLECVTYAKMYADECGQLY